MAVLETYRDLSSGKSIFSRLLICTGDQPLTHLRPPRCELFRPLNGAYRGPAISLSLRLEPCLQALLHVVAQSRASLQFHWPRPLGNLFCLPLRD